jgi:DNA-binding CsgD family transcriptional regulator
LRNFALQYAPLKNALTCLIDSHQLVAAAHLAHSLGLFWETQDYLIEGSDLVQQILDHTQADILPFSLKASLYRLVSDFARHRADYTLAEQYYDLALSQPNDTDADLYAAILRGRGEIAFRKGNYARASAEYQCHLELGEHLHDTTLVADSLNALGRLAAAQGDTRDAYALHRHGKYLAQRASYTHGMGWHLNAVGELHRLDGNLDNAAHSYLESIALFENLRDYGAEALVKLNLAFVWLSLGKISHAEKLFKTVLAFWVRGSAKHAIALSLIGLAGLSHAKGRSILSAKMLGFADLLLQQSEIHLEMPDSLIYEQVVARVSKSLGWQSYSEAHAAGQHSHLDQILSQSIDQTTINETGERTSAQPQLLTQREQQVMDLVAEGLTNKQIALLLHIKPQTINVHLKSIYQKLGTHTRTAAAFLLKNHNTS